MKIPSSEYTIERISPVLLLCNIRDRKGQIVHTVSNKEKAALYIQQELTGKTLKQAGWKVKAQKRLEYLRKWG